MGGVPAEVLYILPTVYIMSVAYIHYSLEYSANYWPEDRTCTDIEGFVSLKTPKVRVRVGWGGWGRLGSVVGLGVDGFELTLRARMDGQEGNNARRVAPPALPVRLPLRARLTPY